MSSPVNTDMGDRVSPSWYVTSHSGQLYILPSAAWEMNTVRQWQSSAAGKVTVSLALHWPCITNSVVYPPAGSEA